ncbi:NAD(+) kinase [Ferrimonas aestuarii]|uniref:NAD kinase n=1 Tax=Ferrimonas aestuarii TaxID=2569539 RepID=A0A4U1BR25_9GAMM|nr:NAD(+) kinase [Ferrimonas aestuarii]TKB55364.1 NAD(+) kinase [Ferrimonas aestuarii]
MQKPFSTIGLIGKPRHEGANQTLAQLFYWLDKQGFEVLIEKGIAKELGCTKAEAVDLQDIGKRCDLAIVVGGDGNMLGAARVLARFDIAVIGVNRGNLGFLTDIDPDEYETSLKKVLDGEYETERRYLLRTEVHRHGELKSHNVAVNEAVLHAGKVAHMIDFEVYIDGKFMYSQRADGMIVATPTGSTAYSLSAGGAILTPNLNANILVPMFPHTLSCRPIVVDGDSEITLRASCNSTSPELEISCDSQVTLACLPGDEIRIYKSPYNLRLIHPKGYNYFEVLRSKLDWGSKLF